MRARGNGTLVEGFAPEPDGRTGSQAKNTRREAPPRLATYDSALCVDPGRGEPGEVNLVRPLAELLQGVG